MTVVQTSMGKPETPKKVKKPENDKLKVHVVSTDLKFVRALAGNDANGRNRAIKRLKQWLLERAKVSSFTEEDCLRLWKGLFYTMWMSDKPLKQEECAEQISNLLHTFEKLDECLLFFKTGLITLQNEWFGIDQLRLDKFFMLVRRFLRQALVALKKFKFTKDNIQKFSEVIESTILNTKHPVNVGLKMHFIEIFLEELAKVSDGSLDSNLVVYFLTPFIKKLAYSSDDREITSLRKFVFVHLIKQHDLGLQYQEKYEAWKALGFPGSIDSIQKVKPDEAEYEDYGDDSDGEEQIEDNKNKSLDPRAGRVNVDLPQIKFNAKSITEAILTFKLDKNSSLKGRKTLTKLAEDFKTLHEKGVYPYGEKRILPKNKQNDKFNVLKSAKELIKFENKLLGKNRKRQLTESGDSNIDISPPKKIKTELNKHQNTKKIEIKNNTEQTKVLNKNKTHNTMKEKQIKTNDEDVVKANKKKKKNAFENVQKSPEKKSVEKLKTNIEEKKTIKKSKKLKNKTDDVVMVFERDSGTWIVTKENQKNNKLDNKISKRKSIIKESSAVLTPSKDSKLTNKDFTITNLDTTPQTTPQSSPSIDTFTSTKRHDTPRFDSLQDFLRHENRKQKMKKQSLLVQINEDYNQLDTSSSSQNGGQNKKVRINTMLNTSQEVDEHIVQVMASPNIPFDSARLPGKPLLKTPVKSSPINPFYRLKKSPLFLL